MTPSAHGGAFRFTFPKAEDAWVLLDASHGGSAVEIDAANRTISGRNTSGAHNAPNFAQYFVAVFDHPTTRHGVWEIPENRQGRPVPNQAVTIAADAGSREGNHVGAYAGFATREG